MQYLYDLREESKMAHVASRFLWKSYIGASTTYPYYIYLSDGSVALLQVIQKDMQYQIIVRAKKSKVFESSKLSLKTVESELLDFLTEKCLTAIH
jgi:hypothetical protein